MCLFYENILVAMNIPSAFPKNAPYIVQWGKYYITKMFHCIWFYLVMK